jgi:hypothetical protein
MKLVLLSLVAIVISTGCATNQGGPETDKSVARIHSISKLAAYSGTRVELIRSPQSRPALEQVRAGVNDLVSQEKWDMAALVIIAGGRFPEMQSDEGLLVLTAAPMLLDLFTGAEWDLRESRYAEATITGIAAGMNLALGPVSTGARSGPVALPPAHGVLEQLQAEARATR